ncbi:MAG: M48 family metalloprotease [Treponema sp.]|nr:M48 family metalloprotease [Treponema sp.]
MRKIYFFFGILFFSQTIFLSGQSFGQIESYFSEMDRIFNEMEYTPSPEEEYYLGRAVAANILASYKLYTEKPEQQIYLNMIYQTLVINSSYPFLYNGYFVMILDNPEFNAFATPGGHVFLTRGLVEAAPSEDALAGIIAHELAHIMLRHGIKIINDMKITTEIDLTTQMAASFSGNKNKQISVFRDSVNDVFFSITKSGYSIPQEYEADNKAAELMVMAGYNPGEFLEMLKILQRIQKNKNGGFNDTHPSPAQRIANLEKQIHRYKETIVNNNRKERFNNVMGYDHE